jgi:hypothetical protein
MIYRYLAETMRGHDGIAASTIDDLLSLIGTNLPTDSAGNSVTPFGGKSPRATEHIRTELIRYVHEPNFSGIRISYHSFSTVVMCCTTNCASTCVCCEPYSSEND